MKKMGLLLALILVLVSVVGFASPVTAAPAPDPSITVSIDHVVTDVTSGSTAMYWSVGWTNEKAAWGYNVNILNVTNNALVNDFNVIFASNTSSYSLEYATNFELSVYGSGTYRVTITLLNKGGDPIAPRFNYAETLPLTEYTP